MECSQYGVDFHGGMIKNRQESNTATNGDEAIVDYLIQCSSPSSDDDDDDDDIATKSVSMSMELGGRVFQFKKENNEKTVVTFDDSKHSISIALRCRCKKNESVESMFKDITLIQMYRSGVHRQPYNFIANSPSQDSHQDDQSVVNGWFKLNRDPYDQSISIDFLDKKSSRRYGKKVRLSAAHEHKTTLVVAFFNKKKEVKHKWKSEMIQTRTKYKEDSARKAFGDIIESGHISLKLNPVPLSSLQGNPVHSSREQEQEFGKRLRSSNSIDASCYSETKKPRLQGKHIEDNTACSLTDDNLKRMSIQGCVQQFPNMVENMQTRSNISCDPMLNQNMRERDGVEAGYRLIDDQYKLLMEAGLMEQLEYSQVDKDVIWDCSNTVGAVASISEDGHHHHHHHIQQTPLQLELSSSACENVMANDNDLSECVNFPSEHNQSRIIAFGNFNENIFSPEHYRSGSEEVGEYTSHII